MLREFVHVVNVVFKNFIQWPKGHDITYVIDGFKDLSGLPIKSQVHIQKPKGQIFVVDYYFFKSKFYSLQMQVVVDHEKQFCDVFVGMLWSMNDSKF
jgi:hypothetical protein